MAPQKEIVQTKKWDSYVLMRNPFMKFQKPSLTISERTHTHIHEEAQWLSGRVLDSRPRGRGFEPHRRHCVVVLEQDTYILALYWFNPGRPVPV